MSFFIPLYGRRCSTRTSKDVGTTILCYDEVSVLLRSSSTLVNPMTCVRSRPPPALEGVVYTTPDSHFVPNYGYPSHLKIYLGGQKNLLFWESLGPLRPEDTTVGPKVWHETTTAKRPLPSLDSPVSPVYPYLRLPSWHPGWGHTHTLSPPDPYRSDIHPIPDSRGTLDRSLWSVYGGRRYPVSRSNSLRRIWELKVGK